MKASEAKEFMDTLDWSAPSDEILEEMRSKIAGEMSRREKQYYAEHGRAHTTAMAGLCYKYKNSGAASDKSWFVYYRVVAIVENDGYDVMITEEFQSCPTGWSEWKSGSYIMGPKFREPFWAEKVIPLKEFQKAKGEFMAEMQSFALAKEGAKD